MIQYKTGNLTVFQSALYKTNAAIVETNDAIIMTDPNWLPTEVDQIKDYLKLNFGNKPLYIIYTHSDFDHIIGAGAFPEAKGVATSQFVTNPEKEAILEKIIAFDQTYYLNRSYKPTYPTIEVVVTHNKQQLRLGSQTITFYHAPGHTDDSLFTVIEPEGIFLSGDYLSDVEFPFIFSSYQDYLQTMVLAETILNQHTIAIHVPGHGSVTCKKEELDKRLRSSNRYLAQLTKDDKEFEMTLRQEYLFFEGMKHIHAMNRQMAKKEE
ncbi:MULTISPECIES: MBL fold metallo-hydrolase [Bacillaceae]|uniref:Hydrolase glyoxylase n=1 Tax=Alkalicoccobacillus plakortidis TaxID=444060 RepID=A0A9D5DNJ0_9BACI|nr:MULTISPECIES: MBL fold metallo-hydrolase [Bacillaceae]KQL51929.1 hydrolase glyoxylase [Alkalicoccobacillus plakortidis]